MLPTEPNCVTTTNDKPLTKIAMGRKRVRVLGIDIGGTKTAWGLSDRRGALAEKGVMPTPHDREQMIEMLEKLIGTHHPFAVGIGIAGTISADHEDVIVCPNVPELSHLELVKSIRRTFDIPVVIDNDARCAMIGEVWLGNGSETTSAVMLTLGTGVGGAVMQREVIQPHPHDISQEMGCLIADPTDLLDVPSGRGSIEGLIGGKNLEMRFGVSMETISKGAHAGDEEYVELFKQISYYFKRCIQAVYDTYRCKRVIIGGKGVKDIDLYIDSQSLPCPVVPAKTGEEAGIFGAARLALDLFELDEEEAEEWGDGDFGDEEEEEVTPEE